MRRLLIGTLGILIIAASACGGSNEDSASQADMQMKADYWAIDQIEKDFHEATSNKDIEQMVSLYAPNATMTVGPGVTASGVDEIREFWLEKSAPFSAENPWVSDHPAYKVEITVNGDQGTLHFECHYIDVETSEVKSTTTADFDVARIDGKWLITNMVGGTTILEV